MPKKNVVLFSGGLVNALFTIFHVLLGLALYKQKGLSPDIHALLFMLNLGGILFILFFTIAFLFYPREVLSTKLGGLSLLFCFLLYGTRAVEEVLLAPGFSIIIFLSCVIASSLFLLVWIMRKRNSVHG